MAESYFIAKLYRQRNSVAMVVPQPVRIELGLKAGNHVVLKRNQTSGKFELTKLVPEGARDGEAKKAQAVIPAAISPR
jgi:bifunctional DNA-binding transcriptional regulator/antitoxin component of YhaV-PrlF toxin-antitoxin module